MTIQVVAIKSQENKTSQKGNSYTLTWFIDGEGRTVKTLAKVEAGKSYDGEVVEEEYQGAKTLVFKRAKQEGMGGGGYRGGQPHDPATMLLSYTKDMLVAGIEAGQVSFQDAVHKELRPAYKAFKACLEEEGAAAQQQPAESDPPKPTAEASAILTAHGVTEACFKAQQMLVEREGGNMLELLAAFAGTDGKGNEAFISHVKQALGKGGG